ncbi:MAG TPA: four helix bundle protein, partial [Polyangiales bacterium]|nr:four helix bundle protein [Polyangiales bacterium]
MLDYERLDVYQCAMSFAALAFQIIEHLPRGHSELSDQFRRATMSVPLNIAEGTGKTTYRERARYHAIARGSAMECGAIMDLLRMQGLVTPEV